MTAYEQEMPISNATRFMARTESSIAFLCNASLQIKILIKFTQNDEIKERDHESQKVRTKDKLKLSHVGPSKGKVSSATNQ